VCYERVYWISAANKVELVSGFQKIAIKLNHVELTMDPSRVAQDVLLWLRQEDNWLLVIDNLDQIEHIDGFLPDRGPNKHTLITTRNSDAQGIPVQGMEVLLLTVDESIEMLYMQSKMDVGAEQDNARRIVNELGCFPLAIEQVASYVRPVTKSFEDFLEDCQKERKKIHRWKPSGNRPYNRVIATTWAISFDYVKHHHKPASKLLQFLSFLNPDVILLAFLRSGASAVPDDELRELIVNRGNVVNALLTLARHSLVKWSPQTQTVSMHRLIQAIMRDEMSETEVQANSSAFIDVCDVVLPKSQTEKEQIALFRAYRSQVVGPLVQGHLMCGKLQKL
jgi:hypothetical protein